MDVYSTAGVPAGRRRTSYWNELYTSHFAQVTFDPVSREDFEAERAPVASARWTS